MIVTMMWRMPQKPRRYNGCNMRRSSWLNTRRLTLDWTTSCWRRVQGAEQAAASQPPQHRLKRPLSPPTLTRWLRSARPRGVLSMPRGVRRPQPQRQQQRHQRSAMEMSRMSLRSAPQSGPRAGSRNRSRLLSSMALASPPAPPRQTKRIQTTSCSTRPSPRWMQPEFCCLCYHTRRSSWLGVLLKSRALSAAAFWRMRWAWAKPSRPSASL
mmetsp:Transcript_12990/g.39322  ORF Transcript_12990/g.39322 Transcript_12990/m.39322 type:complete len:212 (-) Transcript_12990:3009-3644(-)